MHETPALEALYANGVFRIQHPISGVNFSNHISIPNDTTLKPLKLLTINLKDESFHNSIEWPKLYLQVNIPPRWEKFPDLQCSDYWKMHFVKLLLPWYDMIIGRPMYNNPPTNFPHKICPSWKAYWEGGDTMKESPKIRLKAKTSWNSNIYKR